MGSSARIDDDQCQLSRRWSAATGNRELTLQFQGTTQKIAVPENAPLARAVPGSRSDLVVGEYVFTVAQAANDQKLERRRASRSARTASNRRCNARTAAASGTGTN